MSKIDLQTIASLTNEQSALSQINNNSAEIETKSDTFLSRDGAIPNQMEADLDMNSNRILNLLDATNAQEPLTLSQFTATGLSSVGPLSITFIIDGGGTTISTGIKGDLEIPFSCVINRVTMLADISGSIVVDIWKDTYDNYPPTVADTITAAAKPTITTAIKSQDSTLTGWTTSITAGDTLRFNVDSASTITRLTLSLKVTKIT